MQTIIKEINNQFDGQIAFDYNGMYIIKVKGKARIPDYIQLRDERFVLIAYFRADRPLRKLEKYGLDGKEIELKSVIDQLPYGKLQKLSV